MTDTQAIYSLTALLCSGIVGLSLILYGLTQPQVMQVRVYQEVSRVKSGRPLMVGRVGPTGRTIRLNGMDVVLPGVERPGRNYKLVPVRA